ncbi:MAG: LysM peptidoglycan-binding domain-containing protein [Anaerolineae bacterium]|nr:LysM peptidoglycan-binding domain-containing protein [Anaerolineae bacterium]
MAIGWLAYLLFKKDLATQSLGKIISYFIGVVIIFLAIAWIIDSFFITWVNNRLVTARTSSELEQSINIIENVFSESFNVNNQGSVIVPTPGPTPIIIIATPVPGATTPGGAARPDANSGDWPKQHVVKSGETLIGIGEKYGVTYQEIMAANGLSSWTIYPGQTLLIPAPGQ